MTGWLQCWDCIHMHSISKAKQHGFSCDAFPEGIPEDIITNKIKHDAVLSGQVGTLVFELHPDLAKEEEPA